MGPKARNVIDCGEKLVQLTTQWSVIQPTGLHRGRRLCIGRQDHPPGCSAVTFADIAQMVAQKCKWVYGGHYCMYQPKWRRHYFLPQIRWGDQLHDNTPSPRRHLSMTPRSRHSVTPIITKIPTRTVNSSAEHHLANYIEIKNMSALKVPIARAALLPRVALRPRSTAQRGSSATGRVLYTTTARRQQLNNEDLRDDGTSGRFNKSGGSSNNNYA